MPHIATLIAAAPNIGGQPDPTRTSIDSMGQGKQRGGGGGGGDRNRNRGNGGGNFSQPSSTRRYGGR